MNPKFFKKAMGDVTALADSSMDERLKALAKPEAPEEGVEMEGEGMESGESEMEPELTPDEVAKLKALLAQEG